MASTYAPGNGWIEYDNEATQEAALKHTRGCYQVSAANGYEAISGSTLAGNARKYGGRYIRSYLAWLHRCKDAGLRVSERTGKHGKRIIVIAS